MPYPGLAYRSFATAIDVGMAAMEFHTEVVGMHHVPASGPFVVVYNHTGNIDFVPIARSIWRARHIPLRAMARADLFDVPVFGWFMRRSRHIPVDRADPGKAFAAALKAVTRGESLIIAPEQTHSRSWELLPFKSGAARIAEATGAPIIPAASWGSHRFSTMGRHIDFRRGRPVLVEFGEPMKVVVDADPSEATAALRTRVLDLLHALQDRYPDKPAPGDDWWAPLRLGGSAPDHIADLVDHAARESRRRRERVSGTS